MRFACIESVFIKAKPNQAKGNKTMNNTESKIFSEETGHYYNNFSRSGKEMVRNDANASALEKQTGNVCLGESLASLPGVLTEKQFREFVENKVDFRISLPSAYVDGGRIELPNGYSGPNNIYECKDDLRLSFANFIKEVCTKGSTYLKQIKKWNHDGKWVATFDFSSKKTENVHLVYDGEVKSIPLNEQEKIAKEMASRYGRDSITHKIDEFVNYNDFFSKYDALDPQCYEPMSHCTDNGIPIGELVEPITKENRSRLGRIDVDFANFTSDETKKSKELDESFRAFLSSEKSDMGFLPHTSLRNPEGEPYVFLLKASETENWLPLYVNVYLWQHRREWLYGQRPYFFGLVFGDIAKCERECYEKRNKKQLQVILPADMKGNLGAQLREVYFAFREWKTGCKNTADCNIDDALFGEAASMCVSLTTAWNLLNEGKYENFSKVVECLDSIRKEFPSYKPSYDDIIKCFYSSTNQASSQAQQVLEMRTLKSTLGILCSYGICSEDNEAFSNKLEYMCADLEMAELLEKDLYPRVKAYQSLKRESEKQPMPTYTASITIQPIFNFDCFDCLFKQYSIDKIDQWKREFKSSDEVDLMQKLAEADIQRMKDRADEEKIRADERENVLYEMSHHIKNLVVSVIDPLENLAGNMSTADRFVLETAIKGASMIRQIVFFITNSYRFTTDDFLYDISNPVETPQALGVLFENTLRASVASMFDKQTHEKYMRMFYPTKDSFVSAKENWYTAQTLTDVLCFMEKHMNIKVHLDIDSFKNIVIGNTKGSATNLAILYNELTMNMLKALAIMPANERTFTVTADRVGEYVCFCFINSSRNAKSISKGYGKTIVTNIVNGFGGNLSYNEEEQSFQVKVSLPFYKKSTTVKEVTK